VSSFTINNLWANTVTFDLDQFKSNLFISLIFTNDYKLCTGIGYDIEKILFRVLFTMNFWNCKKTLVDDLTDYSSTWTGYNAKYFEDCSSSNNAEIIIFEKEYAGPLKTPSSTVQLTQRPLSTVAPFSELAVARSTPTTRSSRTTLPLFSKRWHTPCSLIG